MSVLQNIKKSKSAVIIGAVFMAIAALLFPVKDGLIKSLSGEVSSLEATMVYFFVQACIAIVILLAFNHGTLLKFNNFKSMRLIFRSIFLIISIFLFFTGVQKAGLAKSVVLFSTQALFTILLSNLLLREKISFKVLLLSFLGFLGVVIIINPSINDNFNSYLLYPFCSAITFSVYIISTKHIENSYSSMQLLLIDGLVGVLITLPIWVILHTMAQTQTFLFSLSVQLSLTLISAGVIGTFSAIMVICSLKLAPASIVSPLGYLEIISASIIGVLVFDELITLNMLAGSVLILNSSFWITRAGVKEEKRDDE